MSIVVAIDGSPAAEAAVDFALTLAERTQADVTFVHAVNAPAISAATCGMAFDPKPTLRALEKVGLRLLSGAFERAERQKVAAQVRLVDADPADAIIESARDSRAGLIVMGTHGRAENGHAHVGSVTEKVLRRSLLPVLAIRAAG